MAQAGTRPADTSSCPPTSPFSICRSTAQNLRGSALKPVENIWAFLRANKLSNRVFDTYDNIIDACCDAWNWLIAQPERITTLASRDHAQVNA